MKYLFALSISLALPFALLAQQRQMIIHFAFNSSSLDNTSLHQLRRIPLTTFVQSITGHADSTGTVDYNQRLAAARINAVIKDLQTRNIQGNYSTANKGELAPVNMNNDTLNRCVVLVLQADSLTRKNTPPIPEGERKLVKQFAITDLLFVADKAVIDPGSIPVLEETAKYLGKFSNHTFEIRGHVNCAIENRLKPGDPMYKLSEDRAKLVYEILADNGIPKSLMTYKGMGNTAMLYPNPRNQEEMLKNIRVEILVYTR